MKTLALKYKTLDLPKEMPLPPNASPGRVWRWKRDLTIYVAFKNGLSQRFLSEVFDLPRSRIGTIVKNFAKFDPNSA